MYPRSCKRWVNVISAPYLLQRFLFSLRYHENCLQLFENPKEIKSAQRDDPLRSPEECALRYIARSIRNAPDKTWISIELHDLYQKKGGNDINRSRFINSLCDQMIKEIYVCIPGNRKYHNVKR